LFSQPPLTRFMACDTPAAYILAVIAFYTALLSVIFGTGVVVMYESCTTHKDMSRLKVCLFPDVVYVLTSCRTCHHGKKPACCCGWLDLRSIWPSLPYPCLRVSVTWNNLLPVLVNPDSWSFLWYSCHYRLHLLRIHHCEDHSSFGCICFCSWRKPYAESCFSRQMVN